MSYLRTGLVRPPGIVRRLVGLACLALGMLGAMLPFVPGLPCFVFAILLLGRRDRTLRHTHLLGRRVLRQMRRARYPLLRRVGWQLSSLYVRVRNLIMPAIIATERSLGRA